MRFLVAVLLFAGCPQSHQSQIGKSCARNGDCSSGQCLPVDGARAVCSAGCNGAADCPPGWGCAPLAGGGAPLCQCTASAERCDGLDNDCNGKIDDGCGNAPMPDLATPPINVTQIDVLFVVDDSPSMMPIQAQLRASFTRFAAAVDGFPGAAAPTSFHIGVVTSDLGAAQSNSSSNCRPGGLGGKLQALGSNAAPTCTAPVGKNYIEIDQAAGTHNLPLGQSLETTFACMSSVGDRGCGFEHVLEAARKALDGTVVENAGFLRDDALLAVVFVTNEDDCSAPPNTDLFELTATSAYGSLLSYRCTQYGIMCGSPPSLPPYADSNGPLAMCTAGSVAAGAKLYEVSRYIDFFSTLKANPRAVLLASLAAPANPVQTIIGNPGTYMPCAAGATVDGVRCAVLLQHSCVQGVFGDPAVRLDQVVKSARTQVQGSVCDGDYGNTLQAVAAALLSLRQGG